ncbi:vinorine synthase-like protein [Tanacetum coccineum]
MGLCVSHKILGGAALNTFLKGWANMACEAKEVVYSNLTAPTLFPAKSLWLRDTKMFISQSMLEEGKCRTKRFVFGSDAIATLKAEVTGHGVQKLTLVEHYPSLSVSLINMSEEDQTVDVAVVPKFDMPSYESKMNSNDVKSLAIRHGIPLDLHPCAQTEGWIIDLLPDDMIACAVRSVNRGVSSPLRKDLAKVLAVRCSRRPFLELEPTCVEGSGYQQKDRKPSQNDKTEHGMEKTVQNQGQSPKMPKSESIQKNQQSNRSRN